MKWLIGLVALGASACTEQVTDQAHSPDICGIIEERSLEIPSDFASQHKAAFQCVENWAVPLSRSPDDALVVADAVMAACGETVMALSRFAGERGVSATIAGVRDQMRELALFRIVQWRAGSCRLPEEQIG